VKLFTQYKRQKYFLGYSPETFHAQAVTINEKRSIIYLNHSLHLTSSKRNKLFLTVPGVCIM